MMHMSLRAHGFLLMVIGLALVVLGGSLAATLITLSGGVVTGYGLGVVHMHHAVRAIGPRQIPRAGCVGIDADRRPLPCIACGEQDKEVCPASRRDCGHHCDHSWTHDSCCWCGKEWREPV